MRDASLRIGLAIFWLSAKWAPIAFLLHVLLHAWGIPHPGF